MNHRQPPEVVLSRQVASEQHWQGILGLGRCPCQRQRRPAFLDCLRNYLAWAMLSLAWLSGAVAVAADTDTLPAQPESQSAASESPPTPSESLPAPSNSQQPAQIWVLDLQGAIGPASSDLFVRSLQKSQDAKASLFVLRLDTPGGLDQAMRQMIQALLASSVPVAVYVHPQGARAASAGTYLLYAAHVAAMTPATNLGAATPIQIGGPASPLPSPEQSPESGKANPPATEPADTNAKESGSEDAEKPKPTSTHPDLSGGSAMEHKMVNDAVAYIRSLAELRGRNADWAEEAVRSAATLTAQEALKQGVIDIVALDTEDLLSQLDGRRLELATGPRVLQLQPYQLHLIEPDWRNQLLAVITDPSVAYILMLIGIYGLFLEFYHPGVGVPGVIGAICLLTALYALQLLPISYAGLGLILLGIGLMVAEAFAPSFGILGIGGVVAFVLGSVMLMDTELPGFQIAMPVIAALATSSVLLLSVALHLALKSRRHRLVSGVEAMIGSQAVALENFDQEGWTRVQGERWRARCERPVQQGDNLQILAVDGLILRVATLPPSQPPERH